MRLGAGPYQVGEGVGEPVDLLGVGTQQRAADHAVVFGAGGGAQRLDALVPGAQRLGEAVGELEEAAAAAPVLAEALAGGGGAVGVREVLGEVVQVGDGGAAPAVDRLAGVADGGDGVTGAAGGAVAEKGGEEQPLGDGGVLVLVQQHHPELLAQQGADLGTGEGEPGGEGDLVAEVDEVPAALGVPVPLGEGQQFAPGPGGLGEFAELLVGELDAVERTEELRVVRGEGAGLDEVLGELRVEREEVAYQGGEGVGEPGYGPGASRSTRAASW